MNFRSTTSSHGFRTIENPDEAAQYKLALTEVLKAREDAPLASGDGVRLAPDGWLCVSVWRLAVHGTGDDRSESGESLILNDLRVWETWLRDLSNGSSKDPRDTRVKMISVALREGSEHENEALVKSLVSDRAPVDWRKSAMTIAFGRFEVFQSVVDSVSPDMSASHLLWVYRDDVPKLTAVHRGENGDAASLSRKLQEIIGQHERPIPDPGPVGARYRSAAEVRSRTSAFADSV